MIKLFSLKQQKKDGENSARPGTQQKKASAAQLRITKGNDKIIRPSERKCLGIFNLRRLLTNT